MKKTILSAILAIVMTLGLFGIATAAAPNNVKQYVLPQAATAPTLDGVIDGDPGWSGNTLTVNFSSVKDMVNNGGYVKYSTKETGATGTMKAVWTADGLYFCWDVKDPTQGFLVDTTGYAFNAADAVQVVLDPLNLGYATAKNCGMCFSFVARTCTAGNGTVPSAGPNWYEHWLWVANTPSIGVQVASWTNDRPDTTGNRVWLYDQYRIEAFIPLAAMNVNNRYPELKVGTQMGIGFTLIDYDVDVAGYDNDTSADKDPSKYQQLINMYTDFGNGKDRFNYPRYYNKVTFADTTGVLPGGQTSAETPATDGENPGEEVPAPTYASAEEAFAALSTELQTANDILGSDKIAAHYKDVAALKTAVDAAAALTAENSVEELTAAVTSVKSARLALEPNETLQDLVDKVKALKEDDYDAETWANIQEILTEAEGFLTEESPDAEAVADAQLKLIKAIETPTANAADDSKEDAQGANGEPANTENENGMPGWVIPVIVVAVIVVIAVIAIIVGVMAKKKKAGADVADGDATPEADDAPADTTDDSQGE